MKHTLKRFLGVSLALVLLFGCLAIGGFADDLTPMSAAQLETLNKPEGADALKFNADGTFKIIQIADLQEAFVTSTMTKDYLRWLAETEKPDLFILTGDNISGGAGGTGLQSLDRKIVMRSIDSFMKVFEEIGIPVTAVLGNHDVESSGVTRWQSIQHYQDYSCYIGYASAGADEDAGVKHWGTHNLLIKNSAGTDAFALWMFDSGDYRTKINPETEKEEGDGYNCVSAKQVTWFKAQPEKALPGLAFQHIIVKEIWDYLDSETIMVDDVDDDGNPVKVPKTIYSLPEGIKGELNETPCPSNYNEGQFAAMNGTGVQAIFFGHDHTNTFEIPTGTGSPMLINSPCTGFGSYGKLELRGARVITLNEDNLTTFDTKLVTYQDFAAAAGPLTSTLQSWRLAMMNNKGGGGTGFTILDWISFKPVIWFLSLLGL